MTRFSRNVDILKDPSAYPWIFTESLLGSTKVIDHIRPNSEKSNQIDQFDLLKSGLFNLGAKRIGQIKKILDRVKFSLWVSLICLSLDYLI